MQSPSASFNRRTTRNAKSLFPILTLTLAVGAAVAAINYKQIEPAAAAETSVPAIPRVVVTASRKQLAEAPITRIVVIGHRADSRLVVAQND